MATAQLATDIQPQSSPDTQNSPKLRSREYNALSQRDKAFIDAYLISLSPKHSALAIGCTPKSASTIGGRLLRKPSLAAAIDAEFALRADLAGVTVAYVLEKTRAIIEHEKTRKAEQLTGLKMLGSYLSMWKDSLDVNITADLAGRVAQARARVTEKTADNGTARLLPLHTTDKQESE